MSNLGKPHSGLTERQQQALAHIRHVMNENFDSWILSFKAKDENLTSVVLQEWKGDFSDVVGLAVIAESRVKQIAHQYAITNGNRQ